MLSEDMEHRINQIAEERLDRAWEEYNAEGPDEEYDPYLEGEQLWEAYDGR